MRNNIFIYLLYITLNYKVETYIYYSHNIALTNILNFSKLAFYCYSFKVNSTSLSVIIPCYNEISTIEIVLKRVLNGPITPQEIIVVDDGSTDGTREFLQAHETDFNLTLCFHAKNQGKGRALKTGFDKESSDIIIIQDADLEYAPENYPDLLKPILDNHADVVYGSRLTRAKLVKIVGFPNYIGNKIFTFFFNFLFNTIFTDIATGYKVFKKNIIKNIEIKSDGFEIEPEITAKIAKNKKINIYEVPITIYSRSIADGKKVRWWDFFIYLYTMIKWRIFK